MTDPEPNIVWGEIIQILEPEPRIQRICVELDRELLLQDDIGKRIHVVYDDNDTEEIHRIELFPKWGGPLRRPEYPIRDVLFDITGIGRIYHSSGAHSQMIFLYAEGERSIDPSLVNATVQIQYTGDIHANDLIVLWSDITRWDP